MSGSRARPGAEKKVVHSVSCQVIAQIVVLDAVFSLDSVITAVGKVDHLSVIMIAVIIAIAVMMVSSKPLLAFVSKQPTAVILCLGFRLMIGFSLIVEGQMAVVVDEHGSDRGDRHADRHPGGDCRRRRRRERAGDVRAAGGRLVAGRRLDRSGAPRT